MSMSSYNNKIFNPAIAAHDLKRTELVIEDSIEPKEDLQSYVNDYELFFINTMHMYLRIPTSLFELYAKEFNKQLRIMHFTLPKPLLVEDVLAPTGFNPPEPGWSRYIHGIHKEDWHHFKDWMLNAKWISSNSNNERILYGCEAEDVLVRDIVKLQTMKLVGIKEFIPMTFFMPSNTSGRLYLNTKNGPPFSCVYVARSSSGAGEAHALFAKIKEMM